MDLRMRCLGRIMLRELHQEERKERGERKAVKGELDSKETSRKLQGTEGDEGLDSNTDLEELAIENLPERRKGFIKVKKSVNFDARNTVGHRLRCRSLG